MIRSSQTHIHILIFAHLNLVHNKNRISNQQQKLGLFHGDVWLTLLCILITQWHIFLDYYLEKKFHVFNCLQVLASFLFHQLLLLLISFSCSFYGFILFFSSLLVIHNITFSLSVGPPSLLHFSFYSFWNLLAECCSVSPLVT